MFEACIKVFKNAHTILLVDWPNEEVPLTLLKAGFKVLSYSAGAYSLASLQPGNKSGRVIFTDLDTSPGEVDIVNIFRPEEEHAEIIAQHVLPLKARAIWL
ncbi:MAG: hypothetical protein M3O71_30695 [Bacteroidota bacterium]|nr:hypothetical protein [Bacteroidota bacterium]